MRAIGHDKLLKLRWLWLFVLVVVPLFASPGLFRELKAADLQQHDRFDSCVTFSYTGGREARFYAHDPDDEEEMRYVFLPSYADMEHVSVETVAHRVEFAKDGEKITVQGDKSSACAFEPGAVYEMYAYDAAGREIGSRQVTFLKSGKLPVMYVTTQTGSMELLDADKAYKEKGWVEFLDAEGNMIFTDELRSISARGNHTFEFEKKSYQIRTHNSVDIMGMGQSDTWILLCNVYDPAYIRNKLTYDMALQAGMYASPKSEYIDVYFNGVYGGMYQLCEKVEIGENRLEIADLEQENKALNGNLDDADTFSTQYEMRKGMSLAYEPEDITGGYLIERDYGEKYSEVASGFKTVGGEKFGLKNPAHASEAQVDYIAGLMQEIEDAICSEDGINPQTGKHFTEYIDLESWADKYLVEEITRNNGGGASSSYFYKPQDALGTKVYGGPVWDYDKGYGNGPGYNQSTRDLGFLTLHSRYTNWFYYLYQHDEFVEAVKREYEEKFADYLTVMSEEKIDEYLEQIEDAAVLDKARFAHVYRDFGEDALDYRAQAEQVRTYICGHKAFLDEVWLENAAVCMVHFKDADGGGNRCFGVKAGECLQALPEDEKEEMVFLGWKIEGTEEYLTTETPIWEETTVYAVYG